MGTRVRDRDVTGSPAARADRPLPENAAERVARSQDGSGAEADRRADRHAVNRRAKDGSLLYTDDSKAYAHLMNREVVNHSVGEYVREQAHINGMESFWSMFRRGFHGVYHRMSPKHLHRYVREFAGRHNIRDLDTIEQMTVIANGMVGKRLRYSDLKDGR